VAFSPQENYTERSATTYQQILVPTFEDRVLSLGQRGGSLRPLISVFYTGATAFLFK
jgi:hypothetical protein